MVHSGVPARREERGRLPAAPARPAERVQPRAVDGGARRAPGFRRLRCGISVRGFRLARTAEGVQPRGRARGAHRDLAALADLDRADRRRGIPSGESLGGRAKKLLIAVHVARDPKWTPCETCACGANGDAGYERWEIKGRWKSRICPRKLITPESLAWLRLYSHYQAGHLAFSGGVLEQPAIYSAAMAYISSVINEDTSSDGGESEVSP
nr:MAG: hypothetical protein DIU56_17595 [Pseudomonadota bacterium]